MSAPWVAKQHTTHKMPINTTSLFFHILISGLPLLARAFNFYGLENLIPSRVIEQDTGRVEFVLYPNPESLRYREELIPDDKSSVQLSQYNASRPLILLIHGFVSEAKTKSGFVEIVKNAYLHGKTEANIVAVDWSHLSTPKTLVSEAFYQLAALNVSPVGKKVASFIIFMIEGGFLAGPEEVHIVGFSLGAHVAGKAGRYYLLSTGHLLSRITGLDPAGPVFSMKLSDAGKVDKSDADFVDIVHTNGGQLGYYAPLGHVDFYVNGGGPLQPNCSYVSLTTGGCSHSAAYRYFAKSIRDETLIACKCYRLIKTKKCMDPCDRPITFGESCSATSRGIYYLPITYDAVDA